MRYIVLFLFYFFSFLSVNASNDDYTLIDCIDWSDSSWVVFDQTKPFQSLKTWIESTISYINSNINISWNEANASEKTFYIKINCSMNDIASNVINLNFNWLKYNNYLVIEWIGEGAFLINNIYFNFESSIANNWSNIEIKNAKFLNTADINYYFANAWSIKIKDSYIKLHDWQSIGQYH